MCVQVCEHCNDRGIHFNIVTPRPDLFAYMYELSGDRLSSQVGSLCTFLRKWFIVLIKVKHCSVPSLSSKQISHDIYKWHRDCRNTTMAVSGVYRCLNR